MAKDLRETDSKIGEDVERKVAAEDRLKHTDIRAPQDGIGCPLVTQSGHFPK